MLFSFLYFTFFEMHIQLIQADCSVLELYMLVCMKRLEVKEQNSYNFNSVMKGKVLVSSVLVSFALANYQLIMYVSFVAEYDAVRSSSNIPDYYARTVCLRVSIVICKTCSYMWNFRLIHHVLILMFYLLSFSFWFGLCRHLNTFYNVN